MIYQPKPGQKVLIRYRPTLRKETGLHMATGTVLTVASGRRTKNVLVRTYREDHNAGLYSRFCTGWITEINVVIPRGNLFKIEDGLQ